MGAAGGGRSAHRKIAWERPLGTSEETLPWLPLDVGTPLLGGAVTTASGLTFIAAAADTRLRALDSASGKTLWDAKLPAGGQVTPSLYAVDGKQYMVIAAGGREGMGALASALRGLMVAVMREAIDLR
ncbi:hypothetical protein [Xanthomonas translucens]|uniref:hypothetical protein n=1 Tax=Xanthomonas campestris pv. translucens TaxID=343 RepID=UPI001E4805EC|nr:hypothetical protein [Xanthomonas translucens]